MIKKTTTTKSTTPRVKKNESTNESQQKNTSDLLSEIKIDIKYKNDTQKKLSQCIKVNDVTISSGPAGTGKSYCAIATALKLLKDHPNKYKKIILLKSISQLKDEMLPALPGDAMEKMMNQNMSFFDSLFQLIGEKNTGELINSNIIKFDVIGGMRGRNIPNSIIILDEAQNVLNDNLKTILTRISDETKIIVLGDPQQIDIRSKKQSSLFSFMEKVKKNPMDGVGVIEFNEDEIVRHRLTKYFIGLFKEEQVIEKPEKKVKISFIQKLVNKIKNIL